jgi:hypothetical protein
MCEVVQRQQKREEEGKGMCIPAREIRREIKKRADNSKKDDKTERRRKEGGRRRMTNIDMHTSPRTRTYNN